MKYYLLRFERDASLYHYVMVYLGRTLLTILGLIVLFILVKQILPNSFSEFIAPISNNYPLMFIVFFLSECFLGLIPPDLFIIWAVQIEPIYFVLLLSILAYIGGIVAFLMGRKLGNYRLFSKLTYKVRLRYGDKIKKWGGSIIVLAALTPIPYSPISMLSGSFNYKLRSFLLFSLTRILRFLIYGAIFYFANKF